MSIDIEFLKQRMKDENIKPEDLAQRIGIDRATFYRKMKAGGVKFAVGEAQRIIEALKLSDAEAARIFLNQPHN